MTERFDDGYDPQADLPPDTPTSPPSAGTPADCPFCGMAEVAMHPNDLASAGHEMGVPNVSVFYAHCDHCGAEGPQGDSEQEAVSFWNQRANAVSVPEPRAVSETATTDPELIKWDAIHAAHRELYRLPPDIGARGLDLNAADTSSDKSFTVREAEVRVIGAAMDWANNDAEDEVEQVAREMGIACCLADLAKALVDAPALSSAPQGRTEPTRAECYNQGFRNGDTEMTRELRGTMECPICGEDTPHPHTAVEISEWRSMEAWRAAKRMQLEADQETRRAQCRQFGTRARVDRLNAAMLDIGRAAAACSFCVDLPRGAEKLKHGCDEQYGLLIRGDVASCPKCGDVLAHWE
jgi:Lar family restriction alleviation protein